jgi:hypothetical protein
MIQTVIILRCDSCDARIEYDERAFGPDDVIKSAKAHGWWAEHHSIRQCCPACKVPAKLAKAMEAAKP